MMGDTPTIGLSGSRGPALRSVLGFSIRISLAPKLTVRGLFTAMFDNSAAP
jgi:hypothetical protein